MSQNLGHHICSRCLGVSLGKSDMIRGRCLGVSLSKNDRSLRRLALVVCIGKPASKSKAVQFFPRRAEMRVVGDEGHFVSAVAIHQRLCSDFALKEEFENYTTTMYCIAHHSKPPERLQTLGCFLLLGTNRRVLHYVAARSADICIPFVDERTSGGVHSPTGSGGEADGAAADVCLCHL